jgi:YVTN family beta-propeller protein
VATVGVGTGPQGAAVTPDGKHAYVANDLSNNVSVIDMTSNNVVATVTVGTLPVGLAITPDGKHVYVGNKNSSSVSVIDTATNTVVATVGVGSGPTGVGIVPPSARVPFGAFSAELAIAFGHTPDHDAFALLSSFTLGSTSDGIDPVAEAVTLQIGTFTTTIPPGSFTKSPSGTYTFIGTINGVSLEAFIWPTGSKRFALEAAALNANLTGTLNPVQVTLQIGEDSGTTSLTAVIL